MIEHLINIITCVLLIFSTVVPIIWRQGRLAEKVENQAARLGQLENNLKNHENRVEDKINKLVEKIDKIYEIMINKA